VRGGIKMKSRAVTLLTFFLAIGTLIITEIFSFDHIPVKPIAYEETKHYQVYKGFMGDPDRDLK